MQRKPFEIDEWYHCYTRGIDKRKTFANRHDYERFLGLLYLCNNTTPTHRSDMRSPTLVDVLSIKRDEPLVGIGAFCLMPNHFHLLIKETTDKGISTFMQKLGTAYTMYFNIKNERTGNLFAKPFRSKHIYDDAYLQQVIQYIHCNPAEIFEPVWKEGLVKDLPALREKLLAYSYSSFGTFENSNDSLRKILDESIFKVETQLPSRKMLEEARDYYADVKVTP